MNVLVIAKAPVPGRSKTRLCPPCTPEQAARVAEAALGDTLAAVLATPGIRPVLALDGAPGPWLPPGFDVVPQRGVGLDERLACAFEDAGGASFLVGMDTPQLTPTMLTDAVERLLAPGVDAVLGPAVDGGWWGIGSLHPDPRAFLGVPMSTPRTLSAQRTRLAHLGWAVDRLPALIDVDRFDDAVAVAAQVPETRFARVVSSLRFKDQEASV